MTRPRRFTFASFLPDDDGGRLFIGYVLFRMWLAETVDAAARWLAGFRPRERARRRRRAGLCVRCGYSLRCNVSGACPECGAC